MRMRQLSQKTLVDVANEVNSDRPSLWGGVTYEIGVDLQDADPFFTLDDTEVPATTHGLEQLAHFLDIPAKFLLRLDRDEQESLLKSRAERIDKPDTVIYWNDKGIQEVRPAGENRVPVSDLVDQVLTVLPEDATVDSWWSTAEDFRLDVVVPEGFDRGVGGDLVVGDITRGGVRVGQDRKRNLAPWVQPYLLRLVCTNGMEVPDAGIKVEARKLTVDEIVGLFRVEVGRAFSRVDGDIRAFYDLRSQTFVDGPLAMLKVAREAGLPDRTVRELAGSFTNEETTMFDIVNHMTEYANGVANPQSSTYRNLQIAGGRSVYDHAERCETCLSRI